MADPKLIIFDEDGTLVDTSPGSVEIFRKTGVAIGKPIYPDSVYRSALTGPFDRALIKVFDLDYEGMIEAVKIFVKLYAEEEGYLVYDRYPGIDDTVRKLSSKYELGVATMMMTAFSEKIITSLGIRDCFSVLHGSDISVAYTKKDLIGFCLRDAGCDPSEAVMIGDSRDDYESAKACGVGFIGVTYGYQLRPDDCRELGVPYAETPSQLLELL